MWFYLLGLGEVFKGAWQSDKVYALFSTSLFHVFMKVFLVMHSVVVIKIFVNIAACKARGSDLRVHFKVFIYFSILFLFANIWAVFSPYFQMKLEFSFQCWAVGMGFFRNLMKKAGACCLFMSRSLVNVREIELASLLGEPLFVFCGWWFSKWWHTRSNILFQIDCCSLYKRVTHQLKYYLEVYVLIFDEISSRSFVGYVDK